MRVFRLIIIVFMIVNVAKSELLAEEGYGGYAGAFLRMGLGARPKALGGAYTAVAEGSYAGYYNPGAFPRNNYKELTLSYSALSLDRNFNYVGLVIPITPRTGSGEKPLKAGVHLGWINAGVDNIDGRDSNGRHYATFPIQKMRSLLDSPFSRMNWFRLDFVPKFSITVCLKLPKRMKP